MKTPPELRHQNTQVLLRSMAQGHGLSPKKNLDCAETTLDSRSPAGLFTQLRKQQKEQSKRAEAEAFEGGSPGQGPRFDVSSRRRNDEAPRAWR